MRSGMVRAGGSGWGSGGEAGQGAAVAACCMAVFLTRVRGLWPAKSYVGRSNCRRGDHGRISPSSHCTLGETMGGTGRAIARWAWDVACAGCLGLPKQRAELVHGFASAVAIWMSGAVRVVAGRPWPVQVHGVLAYAQRPDILAAERGTRRSKQAFNADAGRCTPMHADGTRAIASMRLPVGASAMSAVNEHAGLRPISVHRRASACIGVHLRYYGAKGK